MSAAWEAFPAWKEALRAAEDRHGYDLRLWMNEGPLERLKAPRHAPYAVVSHSVGLYRAYRANGMPLPALATGHSLGFYSAIVAAGVVPLEAALDIIDAVEDLCEARFGTGTHGMAFFIGLSEGELRGALLEFPELALSNLNGKAQFTVSGPRAGLDQLLEKLGPQALKAGLLPVQHPLHGLHMATLMPGVCRRLARWQPRDPEFPLVSHTDGRILATAEDAWDEALVSVSLPVCWLKVLETLKGGSAQAYECGHGQQLASLTRWADRNYPVRSLQEPLAPGLWETVRGRD
jgi:[acyl-carrier-protein] S-malonyltransferase